jgi:ABC-2 type transport system ATP-binding protein
LPEAPYFYRHLSGRELVRFYARISSVPAAELGVRVDDALALVGLADAAHRRVGTYSKGMLQRVGLAQAIVHDPRLVILDEPTAGVDPLGAADIAEILQTMRRRGKTVVLCSHQLGQVEELCDRVAILDKGKLVLEGAVGEVLARREQQVLTTEGLTETAREEVAAVLAKHGAKLLSTEHPRMTLERLFVEKVAKREAAEKSS